MRVVFDTNVVLSACFWRGSPFDCLSAWARGDVAAFVSPQLLSEYFETFEELAARYLFMARAVTVGRGLNYANALELGLKLMETCYVVTERFSSADLMHGPIALVERSFPVFVFAPTGVTWPSISLVLDRLHELKAETLIITDPRNTEARARAARFLLLPVEPRSCKGPKDLYTPIPYIVPAQLFAAHLASIKGINPDSPRTLTKITRTL